MQKGLHTRKDIGLYDRRNRYRYPFLLRTLPIQPAIGAIVVMDAGMGFSRQDAMDATHEGWLVKLH
jgi:hypothetical protein